MQTYISTYGLLRKIGRITFLYTLLITGLAGLTFAAATPEQELLNRRISLNVEEQDAASVLQQIEKMAQVKFVYSFEVIGAGRKVSLHVGNERLSKVLDDLFKPLQITYEITHDQTIMLKRIVKSSTNQRLGMIELMPTVTAPQDIAVSGKVTDEEGSGLPGVSVLIKGTTNGTVTDPNGAYKLNAPDNAILVFSFIGYNIQEVPVNGSTTIDIQLTPNIQALTEVVVVGYGTQRKQDVTGSIITISAKDFNKGQNTTPEQLILGKVAGVQITSNGGAPGAGSTIRIRGGSSLSASNDPLIVIDGVPVDNSELKGTSNALNLINPNDIESFNILKDASATAIYGSRASNGVIIITTKKGSKGDKLNVSFSSLASLSKIQNTINVLSADELREAVRVHGTTAQQALLGSNNTNWQNQIFREAFTTDNNLSLTGSYKSLPYRLSLGYLNQQGILKTSQVKRNSASLSLNPTFLKEHLKVNLNLKGTMTNSRFADQGSIGAAIAFDPTQPVRTDNAFGGYFEWTDDSGAPNTLATRNPLSMLQQKKDKGEVKRGIGNIQFDYKFHFLPDLRANLNLGFDASETNGSTVQSTSMAAVYNQGGSYSKYTQTRSNSLVDFYLNYTKEIKKIASRIDATAGFSNQRFIIDVPTYPTLNVEGDTITRPAFPTRNENLLRSYFGRLNYTFKDRYVLTATIRRDGSSRFSPDNRWGMFPSLAVAWRINEESFLKNIQLFSDLKLRAGYGITGQQDIGTNYYPYLARYTYGDNSSQYQFGNQYYATLRPEGYDANIKWEETTTYNAGLDFGFLNGKISGSVDYYFRKTKDLLALIPPAAGSNLTNQIFTNVGNIENQGVEAIMNFNAITTERFSWSFGVNGTYNQNKITKLSKVKDDTSIGYATGGIGGGTGNNIQIQSVGYPVYSFYVYKQVYDENDKPLEGVYADLNKDGVINEKDQYRYKSPSPKFILGFNSQFSYQKWSLSFVLRANIGNYMYNNMASNYGSYRLGGTNYVTNLSSNVLETNFSGNDANRLFSDYYIENASFLRMDNLNLGYNLGSIYKDNVNLRLTASVQNVFVITKYSGLDPETQFTEFNFGGGIDRNFYPRPRVFSLGINVDFK
jgi:iron complex outermembrane receptor protein